MYDFKWIPGGLARSELIEEMAELYSQHYGVWGPNGIRPGEKIKLSASRLRSWLQPRDSRIAWATAFGSLVGYAIAVQTRIPRHGVVSWVTQLVVHEAHRRNNVGKTLLFTIWHFTNHFAWGLITANPYAVRALEKATRRRCLPAEIRKNTELLMSMGTEVVPYVLTSTETNITSYESRINTEFDLDHSKLQEMLLDVCGDRNTWELGALPERWEWFAFTFQDQAQIGLSRSELEQMLLASDTATKEAYSRMLVGGGEHSWAKYTGSEAGFIQSVCLLRPGTRVLDFGCGAGRHSIDLAKAGMEVVGVDYIESLISSAEATAVASSVSVRFEVADCRHVRVDGSFDIGLCLYDVIGSYADDQENERLLRNLTRHVKPLGYVLLSVMNMEMTERRALNWFSIDLEPDKLLALPASNIMEKTGNVFDPAYYLIDRDTRIVYRKEQFLAGENLPQELLVRDRRYTREEIEKLCKKTGLEVIWSRFVRAGKWDEPLPREDDRAKEILVLCRKPAAEMEMLFPEKSEIQN
jgi:2-polyprenyl-3-methyl-5-hydroxy-6-metoxy-1,4-benzoquinol methylase